MFANVVSWNFSRRVVARNILLFSAAACINLLSPKGMPGEFSSVAFAEDAQALMEVADRARGGVEKGVTWSVVLESSDDGDKSSTSYTVRTKDNDAYVEAVAPPKNKGEVMLFNDRTIWFFKPGLKKPVSISARQKLSGQAANGDIASTNYARDYDGSIVGEDKIDGQPCYKLSLKAKGKHTTYDGITYWIAKKNKLGMKAEYLALDGKPLKIATFTYGNQLLSAGKKLDFVKKVKIVDAKTPANYSQMTYSNPKIANSPDSLFNVNNLVR